MNYIIDHIPKNTAKNRRPGLPMTPTTITIHNTGNPSSTARNERAWLTNPANDRTASYHIVVDEHEAIECIPLNEVAWHAGDGNGDGNRKSIGIEICESGDYAKTLENAATLVARMLRERSWGVDRLRRHFDWSGKICPRLMYDNGKWTGWIAFVNMVEYKLKVDIGGDTMLEELKKRIEELAEENKRLQQRVETLEKLQKMPGIPDWAKSAVNAAVADGIIDTPDGGSYDFYRLVTILHRMGLIQPPGART